MRRFLLFAAILVMLTSLAAYPLRLVRLTLVNKSGYEAVIRLTGVEARQFYYIKIAEGDRDNPIVGYYTIMPDEYNITIEYLSYDATIEENVQVKEVTAQLDIGHNYRLILTEPKLVDTCDPDDDKECKVKYFMGERNLRFLPLGFWYQY